VAELKEPRPGSAADPLWYKDAIIYEVHVRAFADANGDGIGDFQGLMHKLDYLQSLGITCIWLLPFYPSPLRDDGYDIADYLDIHPSYGTLDDFRLFLAAAHDRGLQVMTELVMNHTSDQHPWFQRAREAPPGSAEREYYIWSDTDQKYLDARIIFTDTEKSNWTWDPVAKAYFWHRFFSHQPDLNYHNPRVVEEMLAALRFWLDLGVDGLRLDAIPYLFEREGTNCENLPETHTLVQRFRREIDDNYAGRMLLAEANQWPLDVRPYFGEGDECHMAFHFPLMPRVYVALRQEDRLPITDIIAQTPEIPAACQWALFLRNHDELTLEMVTNDERDYMYLAYGADPRTRLNLGIRRRLAPLMDNNRRRIELLNSLLLSFPGTPVVYYGDEIGMGDNVYLGDRNGVRTPMQWNGDRNAGFSRANPARLYSPVIMDPLWGYQAVNVEAQQDDPSSLLNWVRNMTALRKLFRVFGRGTMEFLNPDNRKVLAYLRTYEEERILCVANLSRFAQPVDLDLAHLEGITPVEMLGYVEFPTIGRQPYRLTLGPYGVLWLELHGAQLRAEAYSARGKSPLAIGAGWASLLEGASRQRFETVALPEYFRKQRWFDGEARKLLAARVADWGTSGGAGAAFAIVDLEFELSEPESFFLPLALALGSAADRVREHSAQAVIAAVSTAEGPGVIYNGLFDDQACIALLQLITEGRDVKSRHGLLRGNPADGPAAPPDGQSPIRQGLTPPGDALVIYGDRLVLKVFRAFQPGPNPDCELGHHLAAGPARFERTPPFTGCLDYHPAGSSEPVTVGTLRGWIENEGDAGKWTAEELERYYESCAPLPFPPDAFEPRPRAFAWLEEPTPQFARDHVGHYLDAAARLGQRIGELHAALASPTADSAFTPEPFTGEQAAGLFDGLRTRTARVFDKLKEKLPHLPDESVEMAATLLSQRRLMLDWLRAPSPEVSLGLKIRIHGNLTLGQVLRVRADYFIVGFEGESGRPLDERRAKQSALKDVASLLHSMGQAAFATLINWAARHGGDVTRLQPWARLWQLSTMAAFLRGYREAAPDGVFLPAGTAELHHLLRAFLLDLALHDLSGDLEHRPVRLRIPLMEILSLPL
jgi:maltose alpha-D-glucosyltransferase / alpha-amylase